jgi:hypothetical protein
MRRKPWRTGRKLGRTLYICNGETPGDDDQLVGMMDTPELADRVVDAVNRTMPKDASAGGADEVSKTIWRAASVLWNGLGDLDLDDDDVKVHDTLRALSMWMFSIAETHMADPSDYCAGRGHELRWPFVMAHDDDFNECTSWWCKTVGHALSVSEALLRETDVEPENVG